MPPHATGHRQRHVSFSQAQVDENANVVVLGDTVATDLFGGQDPLGKSIRIDDALFQVIGVLEASGNSGFGSSDSQVFVPLNLALGRLYNVNRYRGSYAISSITVQVADKSQLDSAELQIEQVLRLRHGLGSGDENDFQISNQADMLEMASDVSGTLTRAARRHRCRQPDRGRHRHHEHHARVGDRTHA